MCDHTEIEYLGVQEDGHGGHIILYNCADCHTTISLNPVKEIPANITVLVLGGEDGE